MYKVVIYDMDGVIIDSEPLWRIAYIKVFGNFGITLTDDQMKQSKGLRVDDEVSFLCNRYRLHEPSPHVISDMIKEKMRELIISHGTAMKGFHESVELFVSESFRLALASSSDYSIIHSVLEKLDIFDYFETVHSAEEEQFGKPHPGVYLSTTRKMNVSPQQCIAIEDSYYGVLAAKAALMDCIAIPEQFPDFDRRFIIADHVLESLSTIDRFFISKYFYKNSG